VTFDVLVKSRATALARLSVRLFENPTIDPDHRAGLEAMARVGRGGVSERAPATGRRSVGWSEGARGETLHSVALTPMGGSRAGAPPSCVRHLASVRQRHVRAGNNLTDYPVTRRASGFRIGVRPVSRWIALGIRTGVRSTALSSRPDPEAEIAPSAVTVDIAALSAVAGSGAA